MGYYSAISLSREHVTLQDMGELRSISLLYTSCRIRESQKREWVCPKGVGPSNSLAWPGWKHSDIAVEVDTARLETSQFKKFCANCVLLYFPSTEFKSAFNVYWHGEGTAGLSCTELTIWEFPFLRGVCWQGWTTIWYCENGMPQKDTLDNLRTPVCFRILSSLLTSVSIFSVSCYSIVSISVVCPLSWSVHYNLAGEGCIESTCFLCPRKIFRHGNKKTHFLVMVYSALFNNVCNALNLL